MWLRTGFFAPKMNKNKTTNFSCVLLSPRTRNSTNTSFCLKYNFSTDLIFVSANEGIFLFSFVRRRARRSNGSIKEKTLDEKLWFTFVRRERKTSGSALGLFLSRLSIHIERVFAIVVRSANVSRRCCILELWRFALSDVFMLNALRAREREREKARDVNVKSSFRCSNIIAALRERRNVFSINGTFGW